MIPVVFSTDHGFVMPTGVAILSMLKHSIDCNCHIYIMYDGSVTDKDRSLLEKCCIGEGNLLSFISMGDAFHDNYSARGVTHPAYYRLRIPWIFTNFDKLIYCDGDVLFKKSIRDLYDIEIGDNYCAGVMRYQYDGYSYQKYAPKIGVVPEKYINSGVMIINCDMMRINNLSAQFECLAKRKFRYFDQDIINIVCKGKVSSLPFEFNVMPTMDIDEKDIYVIHYAGLKPWNNFTRHWYDWWSVYRESPFYDKNIELQILSRPLSIKQTAKIWIKWHYPSLYLKLRNIIGELPA